MLGDTAAVRTYVAIVDTGTAMLLLLLCLYCLSAPLRYVLLLLLYGVATHPFSRAAFVATWDRGQPY